MITIQNDRTGFWQNVFWQTVFSVYIGGGGSKISKSICPDNINVRIWIGSQNEAGIPPPPAPSE